MCVAFFPSAHRITFLIQKRLVEINRKHAITGNTDFPKIWTSIVEGVDIHNQIMELFRKQNGLVYVLREWFLFCKFVLKATSIHPGMNLKISWCRFSVLMKKKNAGLLNGC